MRKNKNYSELSKLETFEERLDYLKLDGFVGVETFGVDRFLADSFYHSTEWLRVRDLVIVRDNACDLGVEGCDILYKPIVHHMNPISADDIIQGNPDILNPEYLITTSHSTHNSIHYDAEPEQLSIIQRAPNDTIPWRK